MSVLAWKSGVILTDPAVVENTCVCDAARFGGEKARSKNRRIGNSFTFNLTLREVRSAKSLSGKAL
jgi:hypothetical protein